MSGRAPRNRPPPGGTPHEEDNRATKKSRPTALTEIPANVPVRSPAKSSKKPSRTIHQRIATAGSSKEGTQRESDEAKSDELLRSDPDLAEQDDVRNMNDKLPHYDHRQSNDEFDSRTAAMRINDALLRRGPVKHNFTPHLHEYTALTQVGSSSRKETLTRWYFTVMDPERQVFYLELVRQETCTRVEAEDINRVLAEMVNRWSGPLDTIITGVEKPVGGVQNAAKRSLIPMAMRHVLGITGYPIRAAAPSYKFHKGNTEVVGNVTIWDAELFKVVSKQFNVFTRDVTAHDLNTVQDPPDDSILFKDGRKADEPYHGKDEVDEDGNPCFPSKVPSTLELQARAKARAMERLARRITFELTDKAFTKVDFKEEVQRLLQLYGSPTQTIRRKGTKFFKIRRYSRRTRLQPTALGIEIGLNREITIQSGDASWVPLLAQVFEDSYKNTNDGAKAWLDAAHKAESINEDVANGHLSPSFCDCKDDQMRQTTVHGCEQCGDTVICARRIEVFNGDWLCPNCVANKQVNPRNQAQNQRTIMEDRARELMRPLLREEALKSGRSTKGQNYRDNRDAVFGYLAEYAALQEAPMVWVSDLTHVKHTSTNVGSTATSKRHDDLSVDAMHSYGIFNGRPYVHCNGNLWVMEQCMNLLKHIQLPAFLQLVAWNIRWYDIDPASPPRTEAEIKAHERKVMKISKRLCDIRLKAGFTQAARTKGSLTEEDLEIDRQEWIAGKLRPGEPGPWDDVPRSRRLFGSGWAPWSAEKHDELRDAAEYWQERFHVTLPQRKGCYYFLNSEPPEEWDGDTCARVCTDRWRRMRDGCNIKDETEDTPETIYIFCIIVVCIIKCNPDDVKDEDDKALAIHWKGWFVDLLRLPLVLDSFDGCCFAITHLIHACQMLTGVDIRNYKSWNPKLCNVLCESRSSNYAKHNYDASVYTDIIRLVKKINIMDKTAYDQKHPVGPRPAVPNINDVDAQKIVRGLFKANKTKSESALDGEESDDEVEVDSDEE